jgi:hypothetical protein
MKPSNLLFVSAAALFMLTLPAFAEEPNLTATYSNPTNTTTQGSSTLLHGSQQQQDDRNAEEIRLKRQEKNMVGHSAHAHPRSAEEVEKEEKKHEEHREHAHKKDAVKEEPEATAPAAEPPTALGASVPGNETATPTSAPAAQ